MFLNATKRNAAYLNYVQNLSDDQQFALGKLSSFCKNMGKRKLARFVRYALPEEGIFKKTRTKYRAFRLTLLARECIQKYSGFDDYADAMKNLPLPGENIKTINNAIKKRNKIRKESSLPQKGYSTVVQKPSFVEKFFL